MIVTFIMISLLIVSLMFIRYDIYYEGGEDPVSFALRAIFNLVVFCVATLIVCFAISSHRMTEKKIYESKLKRDCVIIHKGVW